jgi:hypothetical protein
VSRDKKTDRQKDAQEDSEKQQITTLSALQGTSVMGMGKKIVKNNKL